MKVTFVQDFVSLVEEKPDQLAMHQYHSGGDVDSITWGEVWARVLSVGSYLKARAFGDGARILIFANNQVDWLIADIAIMLTGHVSVPIYPLLNDRLLENALDTVEPDLIFFAVPNRENVISSWSEKRDVDVIGLSRFGGMFSPISRIFDTTGDIEDLDLRPDPDKLATIMFTSGTSGNSKGVMHSFKSLSLAGRPDPNSLDRHHDRVLSIGTFAHVSERAAFEIRALRSGLQIFFCESGDTVLRDLRKTEPTHFFSHPLLWQNLKDHILEHKSDVIDKFSDTPEVLRGQLREWVGFGKLKAGFVAAFAMPAELTNWIREYLGVVVFNVYGMTETFTAIAGQQPGTVVEGSVGVAGPGVEVRIGSDGGVEVKHPGTTLGYWRNPESTQQLLLSDGFIRTGDLGYLQDQNLFLSGRIGDLFRTSRIYLISPFDLEAKLLDFGIFQFVCVMGEARKQPYAAACLSPSLTTSYGSPDLEKHIFELVTELNHSLADEEQLDCICVTDCAWNTETGLLTPTMKLHRSNIMKSFPSPSCTGNLEIIWSNSLG